MLIRRVFCPLDILSGRRAADVGIAAGREAVGDVHGVAGPVSRVPRPEGLRQTKGERHSNTVHPAERQEIYGGEGLAVVAPFGQDHAVVERAPDRVRTQTEIGESLPSPPCIMLYSNDFTTDSSPVV